MWIAPRLRAEREASAPKPPTPSGETLAEFDRGQGITLRLSAETYESHPFVRLQQWQGGYPIRGKGCSLRLRELPEILEALGRVVEGPDPRESPSGASLEDTDRPKFVDKGRRPQSSGKPFTGPKPRASVRAFNEMFDETGD